MSRYNHFEPCLNTSILFTDLDIGTEFSFSDKPFKKCIKLGDLEYKIVVTGEIKRLYSNSTLIAYIKKETTNHLTKPPERAFKTKCMEKRIEDDCKVDEQIKINDIYYYVTNEQRLELRAFENSLYGSYDEETHKQFQEALRKIKKYALKAGPEQDVYTVD